MLCKSFVLNDHVKILVPMMLAFMESWHKGSNVPSLRWMMVNDWAIFLVGGWCYFFHVIGDRNDVAYFKVCNVKQELICMIGIWVVMVALSD